MRWLNMMTAVLLSVFVLAPVAAAQDRAQPGCATPSGRYSGAQPWGQRVLDAARIWPLAKGGGQLVAVIGTGVDADHAQFRPGQVLAVRGIGAGAQAPVPDCDGRGTVAAGIVAAQPDPGTSFAGIAPEAKVLPVRYFGPGEDAPNPDALAAAIVTSAQENASVILIAVPALSNSPALTAAVEDARRRGAVIVSAAAAPEQASYPTATPGVLAVGSVDESMQPVQPEAGPHLALAAPGAGLVSASAGSAGELAHRWPVSDPALAAAQVAGAAALLRSYRPELTPDQVAERLTATAHRPPSGAHDPRLGWGLVDAYRAVTAELGPERPVPAVVGGTITPAPAPPKPATDEVAAVVALAGVGVAAASGIAMAAVRRGRKRGWRPGRRSVAD